MPTDDFASYCIACGHSVAVCPTDAFRLNWLEPDRCPPIDRELQLSREQAEQFLRSRRSIRAFREKPVERAKLEKLIEMACYAPSAKNHQPWHWAVVESPAEVRRLAGLATDDERILQAAQDHGWDALLTRTDHVSGTDRIAEVAGVRNWRDDRIVVNVQGDEPRIAPELIRHVAQMLVRQPEASMSTACHALTDARELFDPNSVKVVLDHAGDALYFSRATIPWARDAFARDRQRIPDGLPIYRHIGIYGYRCGFLKQYPGLQPPAIEPFEALEQLRALWHGHRIAVAVTDHAPEAGVDTPADLEKVRRLFGPAD